MCLPAVKYLSAFNNSTSNLQKHVLRKHPSKQLAFSRAKPGKRTHQANPPSPSKQTNIKDAMTVGGNRRVPQGKIDKIIIRLICEGLHTFSLVEQPAFKELLTTLNPQCKVISRPTVRTRLEASAIQMKKNVMWG
ncbi:E3 SUMO-protein ligase ZBED1-like [Lampris incognitus]|uniref:E3 SUMO-protein ligase ZBED1-like n=1 Tax=Lampris incognitus TaxID=2546036 RepID=UPI0024B5C8E9|nr:E3 SUMO-protein ligase ZBED1-like [Lampris incognitus]